MTGHERHRLPDEPDPDEVAEAFGIEAGKDPAGKDPAGKADRDREDGTGNRA